MKTKEQFCLSDYIEEWNNGIEKGIIIDGDKIKEFIIILKEEIFECDMVMDETKVYEIIDKLVGDKLV